MNDFVYNLKRFGQIADNSADMHIWDEIDDKSKLYYLWESEIDGVCSVDDYLSIGECIMETNKRDLIGTLRDELDNKMWGYDVEDSNHYTIKYANGEVIHSEDIEDGKLRKTGIIWICPTGGITYNRFFAVNKRAKQDMLDYMGFNEIVRGEIKGIDFDYTEFEKMQDDWI